jgi:hypothetical protein
LRAFEEESFGFFAKEVAALFGGGVTAGSTLSRPSDFFVKELVAIFSTGDGGWETWGMIVSKDLTN